MTYLSRRVPFYHAINRGPWLIMSKLNGMIIQWCKLLPWSYKDIKSLLSHTTDLRHDIIISFNMLYKWRLKSEMVLNFKYSLSRFPFHLLQIRTLWQKKKKLIFLYSMCLTHVTKRLNYSFIMIVNVKYNDLEDPVC